MKVKYFLVTVTVMLVALCATAQQKYPEKPDLKWTPPANYYTSQPPVINDEAKITVEKTGRQDMEETKPANATATAPAAKLQQKKAGIATRKTKNQ